MADAGKIMLTVEGDYSNTKPYERLSIVNTSNGTYISKKATKGNNPDEDSDEKFWLQIKSRAVTDSALSKTSTNPVQNQIITAELEKKFDANNIDDSLDDKSENPVQNKVIADAISKKLSISDIDGELDDESENPVQNKVIKAAFDEFTEMTDAEIDAIIDEVWT